ncbi:hypothetical protein CCZ20_24425 [Priestia aryabhattai]|uniref:hypothetical protein n=1 Tax=Priestia aryabhattai TaxID=412384 RepID=UPI000B5081E0|nr:hypothetical protein [Priestia aryabhattai]OVE34800.1 hypothetical protein CCZ20_24425 [Priestia aryabhattai]
MSLQEIKYLLTDANKTLDFIYESYTESLAQPEVSIALRLKIKHFLENIQSSLDYMGYYIFTEFCADKITSKFEDHVKHLYFPIRDNENKFNKYITSMYKDLSQTKPEIVHTFKSVQPFNEVKWFANLNELVNKNKHRHLTKQRIESATHIHSMSMAGITIKNSYSIGNGTDILYGDKPINFRTLDDTSEIDHLDATVKVNFIFTDLNLPVLPTLKDIYLGASSIIKILEEQI